MKIKMFAENNQRNFIVNLIVLALAISMIFVFTGCSVTYDTTKETTALAQTNVQPVEHDVDTDPTPLDDHEKSISLEGYGAKGALADETLTINDMLTYAVQDEYLAHGEYAAIIEKFGSIKPYTNIIRSEQTHLDYLKEVYLSYELEFPADESKEHIVIPVDLLEAAKTGVQAEIDNIAMYEIFLTYDLPENVFEVFTALMKGSESHLLAFEKQVDRLQ